MKLIFSIAVIALVTIVAVTLFDNKMNQQDNIETQAQISQEATSEFEAIETATSNELDIQNETEQKIETFEANNNDAKSGSFIGNTVADIKDDASQAVNKSGNTVNNAANKVSETTTEAVDAFEEKANNIAKTTDEAIDNLEAKTEKATAEFTKEIESKFESENNSAEEIKKEATDTLNNKAEEAITTETTSN